MTNKDEVRLSAFLSPNKDKLVVVAINLSSKTPNTLRLKLGDFEHTAHSVIYRTTFPNTQEQFSNLGALGADQIMTLPPQSVATLELTK
jgi:O-glycosyl hydrolase